jgi:hypothetical protein
MRRILLFTFTLLMLISSTMPFLHAQEEDYDRPRKRQRSGGIFGGGGGVVPTWVFLETKTLNNEMLARQFPSLSEDGMFLMGGHGYGYIIFIPNLRIGGLGAGGSLEATSSQNGMFRSTKLALSYGGVTLEYVVPFGRFHVAIGGLLGSGTHKLTLTQTPDESKDWNATFPYSGSRHEFTNDFFTYQPTITLEYDINPFIVFGLTGGYLGSSGNEWEMDERFPVRNMPDFKFASPFLRASVTFGLFIGE